MVNGEWLTWWNGEREEGRKGGRRGEEGELDYMLSGEDLLAAHDCGFAGSGGFDFF